jgi:tetratricopeptide (TPR) repeat protein
LKKRHWLNLAEYASVAGLGAGALASVVFQKMIYLYAPLSFWVLLSLVNRRRFEEWTEHTQAIALTELNRKIAKHVELLNQQIQTLPTPETVGNVRKSLLRKDRENLEKVAAELQKLRHETHVRLAAVEKYDFDLAQDELEHLKLQYSNLSLSLAKVTGQIHRLSDAVGVDGMETDIAYLKTEVSQLQSNLQKLTDHMKPTLASVQDQVNSLNRQFQKLPPPFDATALKEEVNELVKVVSDLVPRRDWNVVIKEIQSLHRQQESQAAVETRLRREIQTLQAKIQSNPATDLRYIQVQINRLDQKLRQLPPPFDATDLIKTVETLTQQVQQSAPQRSLARLAHHLHLLKQAQVEQTESCDRLRMQVHDLQDQLRSLPDLPQLHGKIEEVLQQRLDSLSRHLQQQLYAYAQSVAMTPSQRALTQGNLAFQTWLNQGHTADSGQEELLIQDETEFQERIAETLQRELSDLSDQLQNLPEIVGESGDAPLYEFVFDVDPATPALEQRGEAIANTMAVLDEALDQAQTRLIVVWPWSKQGDLAPNLLTKFQGLLDQGCEISIGWCHRVNREVPRFLSSINRRWAINPLQQGTLQHTLQALLNLKRLYPERFHFKILGTLENFLVCDQSFAILGVDHVLVKRNVFPNLELKLRTSDQEIIQRLTDRFDRQDLDPHDLSAYWNRAVTRYDLGDKQGALEDFNHIVANAPEDATAYNYRGTVRYDLNDRQGALEDFNQSIHINPHQVDAYCNRGLIRTELKSFQEAIADYSRAIWASPALAIAHFYRGLAYQKLRNYPGALTDYSEAIHLAPEAAAAYYHRGIVSQKMGDRPTAIADFAKAAELFRDRGSTANAQRALQHVQQLQQTSQTAS